MAEKALEYAQRIVSARPELWDKRIAGLRYSSKPATITIGFADGKTFDVKGRQAHELRRLMVAEPGRHSSDQTRANA